MARLVVLYRRPADAAAFDRYYVDHHVPLAKAIPGLQSYEVSDGAVSTPAGPAPYHLVATLSFESMGALQQGMGSAEGRAAAADVAEFASGGVEMLIFDERLV